MSQFCRGEPAAPAAARNGFIPLPRPEKAGSETAIMSVLCLAAAVAVLQFFASMASFAEQAPRLADRFETFRPEFVRHVYAVHPATNEVVFQDAPATPTTTAIAAPGGNGRSPS